MRITEKTKEYECCCSCKHNIRKKDGNNIYCECEIDKHYIGYIASFENVCESFQGFREYPTSQFVKDVIQINKEVNADE